MTKRIRFCRPPPEAQTIARTRGTHRAPRDRFLAVRDHIDNLQSEIWKRVHNLTTKPSERLRPAPFIPSLIRQCVRKHVRASDRANGPRIWPVANLVEPFVQHRIAFVGHNSFHPVARFFGAFSTHFNSAAVRPSPVCVLSIAPGSMEQIPPPVSPAQPAARTINNGRWAIDPGPRAARTCDWSDHESVSRRPDDACRRHSSRRPAV